MTSWGNISLEDLDKNFNLPQEQKTVTKEVLDDALELFEQISIQDEALEGYYTKQLSKDEYSSLKKTFTGMLQFYMDSDDADSSDRVIAIFRHVATHHAKSNH